MFENLIGAVWIGVLVYALLGAVFAIPFVSVWAGRLDSSAGSGNWGFRLAIIPGVIALWPLLARRLFLASTGCSTTPETEASASAFELRRLHGLAWCVLLLVMPVICIAALVARPAESRSIVRQLPPEEPSVADEQTPAIRP